GVCTHLHDQIALVKTFEKRLTACDVTRKPFAHERVGGVLVGNALFGVEAQDVVEAGAEPSELRRVMGGLAERAISAIVGRLLYENRYALTNMGCEGFNNVLTVMC